MVRIRVSWVRAMVSYIVMYADSKGCLKKPKGNMGWVWTCLIRKSFPPPSPDI